VIEWFVVAILFLPVTAMVLGVAAAFGLLEKIKPFVDPLVKRFVIWLFRSFPFLQGHAVAVPLVRMLVSCELYVGVRYPGGDGVKTTKWINVGDLVKLGELGGDIRIPTLHGEIRVKAERRGDL
jgi:hypothetical protein